MSTVAVMSERYDKLPKQESFSKRQVEQIIHQEWSVCREQRPWIFTPGCLMLVGAINTAVKNFRKHRFKPGTARRLHIPISYRLKIGQ